MNNVFTKNQAAGVTASGDRLTRFVRNGVLACVLACSAAGAMAAGHDRGPRQDMQQQSVRDRFDSRAQDQRAYEMQMREEARRRDMEEQARLQQRDEARRGGRMTPDERRDLRRQINEANMDLYPPRR